MYAVCLVFFSMAGSLVKISEKLNEVVATARNMCNALTHCLDLLSQQEEVRSDSGNIQKYNLKFMLITLLILPLNK